jgi:hypothetical protein
LRWNGAPEFLHFPICYRLLLCFTAIRVAHQITTTDIHLTRGIGEALHHAQLEYHYNDEETLLRVMWQR